MSIALMTEAWTAKVSAGTKLVLLSLCDNANDEGECWPSVATIASRCSMGIRTVQAHLMYLEGAKMISRGIRTGHSNVYQIHPSNFRTPAKSAVVQISHPPPQNLHPTPAESAPPPPQISHPESSVESSRNHQGTDRRPAGRSQQTVPQDAIVAIYHELLPMCPRVHVWSRPRKAKLNARWTEAAERQSLDWWREYFRWVSESSFLTGRVSSRDGRPPFLADLEWLIGEQNLPKVIEGKYHREAA